MIYTIWLYTFEQLFAEYFDVFQIRSYQFINPPLTDSSNNLKHKHCSTWLSYDLVSVLLTIYNNAFLTRHRPLNTSPEHWHKNGGYEKLVFIFILYIFFSFTNPANRYREKKTNVSGNVPAHQSNHIHMLQGVYSLKFRSTCVPFR